MIGFDDKKYELLYSRFDKETVFMDYIRIFVYGAEYSASELKEIRIGFKNKCEKYDIARLSESKKVSEACIGWGI